MRLSKAAPKVNAGSMADIAFLLLIFFLVTTTIASDEGINRKLPRICETDDCKVKIHERNILRITLNNNQEVMIDENLIAVEKIKDIAKAFLDNNGDRTCDYCNGSNSLAASDNPIEAVISLQTGNQTSYELFIAVQNELNKAYNELREVYALQVFGRPSGNLSKEDLIVLKKAYPFILSEAETK